MNIYYKQEHKKKENDTFKSSSKTAFHLFLFILKFWIIKYIKYTETIKNNVNSSYSEICNILVNSQSFMNAFNKYLLLPRGKQP